jgi:hypothetical protein
VEKEREHLYFDEYDFASDEEYMGRLREQFGESPPSETAAGDVR